MLRVLVAPATPSTPTAPNLAIAPAVPPDVSPRPIPALVTAPVIALVSFAERGSKGAFKKSSILSVVDRKSPLNSFWHARHFNEPGLFESLV